MDRLARKVAARWAFKQALGPNPPAIPAWVFEWGDRLTTKIAYLDTKQFDDTTDMRAWRPDNEIFQDAKESVNILLPKFLDLLRRSLHEQYHANASQTGNRIYYYFASNHSLETISLSVIVKRGVVLLALAFIPHGLTNDRPDYSKTIEEQERISDPELAGLALMRLARKVLARV